MKRKILVVSGEVVVAGLILGVAVAPSLNLFYGSIGLYMDYFDESDLVENSTRIVVVKYLGEASHVVATKNAYDDAVLGETTLVVQRFENIESLKGNAAVGDMTYIASKSVDLYNLSSGIKGIFNEENVSLSVDEEYVVFLRPVPPRPEYNGQYGDDVWAYLGEPSIAQIQPDTGNFQFKTTKRYRSDRDVLSTSGAPFELSKQEVLELVSSGGAAE